jgi:hypothetical protein
MRLTLLFRPLMYLDPGTGSLLIQIVLAGFLGIAVVIRVYWKKIIRFFTKNEDQRDIEDLDEIDEYMDKHLD